ncbi:ECF transporter S component [Margalitia sp. FSL K6-0131]|uniref:ECF transporter S component n=1 Tax=Margalitia sp. FSL K6-0131 TaxID=2954604 RepID=UPI0030FA2B2C
MKRGIRADFNLISLLLIPVGVAINMVGFQITNLLKLPIFLDTIGTILIAVIAGPWVAICAGIVTNLINAIFNPTFFPYVLTSIAIGLVVGYLAKYKMFTKAWKVVISGLIVTIVAMVVSAPITVYVFGGAGGSGASLLTATFLAAGQQLWSAVLSSSLISEIADKLISVFICYFIVKSMSERYLSKLKYGHLYMKQK